jgi:hypothetical protein
MRGLGLAVVLSALTLGAGVGVAMAQQPGAVSAAYTVEPFTPASTITINASGVRLRAEPFANQQTPVLSTGSTGLPLTVVGIARMPDWTWYQVILKNGQKAFIRSDLTSAPSRGGTQLAGAPSPAMPAYPAQPAPTTSAALPPAPTPPAYQPPSYQPPAYQPPAYQPPAYQPPPVPASALLPGYATPPSPVVGAPSQPAAPVQTAPLAPVQPAPTYTQPIVPVQPAPARPAPAPAQPAGPDPFGGGAISLVPKPVDPAPASASPTGATGLQSQR